MWKYYALLSAFFAALTAIFAKVGVKDINSDLATAIRTTIILVITWGIVFVGNHQMEVKPFRAIRGYSFFYQDAPRDCPGFFISRQFSWAMFLVWLLSIS